MYAQRVLLTLSIFSLSCFLYILYDVSNDLYLPAIDSWVYKEIGTLHTDTLTKILTNITNISGIVGNTLFAMIVILFLSYRQWYKERLFYLLSFGGSVILFLLLKQLIARPRPDLGLVDVINYSFPSGHATLTMTTILILYFILSHKNNSKLCANIFLIIGILWAGTIAFTRIYLGVHWLSDVIAGLALALFWVTFVRVTFYSK